MLVGGQGPAAAASSPPGSTRTSSWNSTSCSPSTAPSALRSSIGEKQENASKDPTCLYNSGMTFRTGYQVNIGRREAGEFIGIVVHRQAPGAIRGNVLWLDKGRREVPGPAQEAGMEPLCRSRAKGPQLTVILNGTKICDVKDNPTDPAEAKWKEAGPISAAVAAGGRIGRDSRDS